MSRLKSFENIRRIYFVAAHKLILNVSKIRLRLICARALYLRRLFSKALLYGRATNFSAKSDISF